MYVIRKPSNDRRIGGPCIGGPCLAAHMIACRKLSDLPDELPVHAGRIAVHDLNQNPSLPFIADGTYDAVLCALGVQYLEEPEQVSM